MPIFGALPQKGAASTIIELRMADDQPQFAFTS